MTYVAHLRAALIARDAELQAELADLYTRLDAVKSEASLVQAGLIVLPESAISQLELQVGAKTEGGPKSPDPAVADLAAHRERKAPVRLRPEPVRDWIVDVVGEREFSTREVSEHFNVSFGTAASRCEDLLATSIIVFVGKGVWKYNTSIPKAPTSRPRGERLVGVPAPRRAGTAVPGTGVPAGPAETPGKLKRQQRKAKRVLHKPVKGVRL